MADSKTTSTPDLDSLTIVRDPKLAEMLDCSTVTLWRMSRDPKIGLPRKIQVSPGVKGRRLSELKAWFEERAARG